MAGGFSKWGHDLYTGEKSYNIVGRRKAFYAVAIIGIVLSFAILGIQKLNFGIEFRGGSQFTISNTTNKDQQAAIEAVTKVKSDEVVRVSNVGQNAIRVQTSQLTEEQVQQVRTELATAYNVDDAAIIALFHDLIITVGIYALIGWEVTPATVIGLLTILGYSIYDTVVVFDKVRENTADITEQHLFTYEERANLAVNQTLVRSINTSVVALLPVGAILFIGAFLLGAGTLRDISLSLFVGMAVGAYSSIFLATPLEVSLRLREPKIAQHTDEVLSARSEQGSVAVAGVASSPVRVASGQLKPGQHLGNRTQPKRKRK